MRSVTSFAVAIAALVPFTMPMMKSQGPAERGSAVPASAWSPAPAAPGLEVLEEGGEWRPVGESDEGGPEEGAACTVMVRWQTSAADLNVGDSKVRVRGLPWVRIGEIWGPFVGHPTFVYAYRDDPGNTLFYMSMNLNQSCDRYRRYRFRLEGRSGTRFSFTTRDLYFPRENGFTKETDLDLGYLDLCMADGHECDQPYYPGGNQTPWPSGQGTLETTRTQPLTSAEPSEADESGEANSTSGVVVNGQDLTGDWVRTESNNDPNNGMRITVGSDGATLSVVPSTSSSFWSVGQVLWRNLTSDGTLEVRGSDGRYYAARLTLRGTDQVGLDIQHNGPGNDQTWVRAGPSIEGEWVQINALGGENDGLKIRVQGEGAFIRYLPAAATRGLRTGGRIWRNITPSGSLEVLGSDGNYHPATATLDANRLRIHSAASAVVDDQIWVRPGAVDDARMALAGPVEDPSTPGADLKPPQDLPTIDLPPATPPPDAITGACLTTSLPADEMGVDWGWGLVSSTNNRPLEENLGIRELMLGGFQGLRARANVIADLERVQLPGLEDGFSFVWQPTPSRRFGKQEERDLTASEFEQQSQESRDSGLRPSDIEAYQTPSGMRYAGVWVENSEAIGWWSDYDLTGEEYGQAFQNLHASGYRLVDMEAYQTPDGLRYAAIWYQSCDNDNWSQLRGMDREDYQMEVDSRGELGFRVVDFESYETDEGQRYAAVWQKIPAGRAWAVRTDRSLKWFLNYHRQYVDEGLRLIDFESYDTPEGVRYAGVWGESEPRYDYPFKTVLDTIIGNYRTTHGIPGISVVVMHADSVLYRRGFGWADSARAEQAYSGTVYLTASVAKVIGATMAARLEERGELDLAAPTADYLDDLPAHHTHTVEQLLSKTGCVPHYREATPTRPDTTRTYTYRIDALKQMWADTLLGNPTCIPGQHYRYSTHGFTYVGAVLEEVMGEPIADILVNELTKPLSLMSMQTVTTAKWGGYGGLGVKPHDLAQGYVWNGTNSVPRDYENSTWKVLGGGLQTNALDLARFGALTLSGSIVADTARLWTPLTSGAMAWNRAVSPLSPTGLAWEVGAQQPSRLVRGAITPRQAAEHGGAARGARSVIRLYRDGGLVIAILTNQRESATLTNSNGNPRPHPVGGLATRIATAIFSP